MTTGLISDNQSDTGTVHRSAPNVAYLKDKRNCLPNEKSFSTIQRQKEQKKNNTTKAKQDDIFDRTKKKKEEKKENEEHMHTWRKLFYSNMKK